MTEKIDLLKNPILEKIDNTIKAFYTLRFETPFELNLMAAIEEIEGPIEALMSENKYLEVLKLSAVLTNPLNEFLNNVRMDIDDIELLTLRRLLLGRALVITNLVCDLRMLS